MRLPVSVIIPTMNRPISLGRTLQNMVSGDSLPSQVIIIDQTQDLRKMQENLHLVEKYKEVFTKIDYIYQENPSSTKARNAGVRHAENEIIVFADDDIDVNHDTIKNLYDIIQKNNEIAMIAGIDELMSASTSSIGYFLGTKSFRNRKIGHVTYSMLGRYPDNITKQIETQWAMGYFFVVKKSLVDKWECIWDENLSGYAYAEDLDFSYNYYKHAKAEGLKCILDPNVKVKHLASLEYRIPNDKSLFMYIINRTYLCHKHKMGIKGIIACYWCNFWRLIQNIIKRQQPRTMMNAILCSIKFRKEIKIGDLDYKKFMQK